MAVKDGVSESEMKIAVENVVPDLQLIGGFVRKTLFKAESDWVDIYVWESLADAEASHGRMAEKQSFQKLISLVKPETISITILENT